MNATIPKDFWTVDYPRSRAAAQAEIDRMKVRKSRWDEGYDLVGWFSTPLISAPIYLTTLELQADPYGTMSNVSHAFDIDSPEALALIAGEMLALTANG